MEVSMKLRRRELILLFAAVDAASQVPGAPERPVQQPPPPNPEATADVLRNVLGGLVRYEVVRRGAGLAAPAEKEVDSFISGGVNQLLKRNEIANDFVVSIAIDGARRFGGEIVVQAIRAKENLKNISAGIVQNARSTVCPLFPFC
jgi:hypothetical protein